MRRIALSGLLLLSGCTGFNHFIGDTHTFTNNPNPPAGDSANMQRAYGHAGAQEALLPETGQVWPTAIPAMPTLADIQKQMNLNGNAEPQLGPVPGGPTPNPNLGPVPGLQNTPGIGQVPGQVTAPGASLTLPPLTGMTPPIKAPFTEPPELVMPKVGTSVTTPQGPATITGGTANYQTLAPINGQGGGILIPNGNGTSTLVMPNGSISTVNSPR
ncbi:hypothetical protein [Acidisoma sp.]|uniref:hypothetical protein n=1 Tax=Acidisoma sp. TaxID=1872115 RepID=UPI003B00BF56